MDPFISLWITERESGICIVEAHFREGLLNASQTDILSGFIIALLQIADEIHAEGIESVQLGNSRIIYDVHPRYVIVAWVDPHAKNWTVNRVIEQIGEKFDRRYEPLLETWKGKIDDFDGFHDEIDQMWEERKAGGRVKLKFWRGRKMPSLAGTRETVARGISKIKKAGSRGKRGLRRLGKFLKRKARGLKEHVQQRRLRKKQERELKSNPSPGEVIPPVPSPQ